MIPCPKRLLFIRCPYLLGPIRAAVVVFALTGCQSAQVGHPLTEKLSGNDPDSQMEFWHSLADRRVTSNDEALHGLLLYVDGKDDSGDYQQRVDTLKSRHMLPGGFNAPAHAAISRGDLAVAMVKALQIKGGIMLHLAANSPRYAIRELQYLDLYPPSSPQQTFNGSEFLGIIGKLEDYQRSAGKGETAAGAAQIPLSGSAAREPAAGPGT